MTAHRVYMGEFNVLMNGTTYLPLVSGILRAHAENDEAVREHFAFEPFRFHIDEVDRIVDSYVDPAVVTFSMSMWNARLSLAVADRVKRRFPDCLVVVGGASVPHAPHDFLRDHSAIDVAVRGEGEDAFLEILRRVAGRSAPATVELDDIPNTTWRTPGGEIRVCLRDWPMERDLDVYPSPYLAGVYEDLFADNTDLRFQAIVETNRGCPFKCTFCYWGKGGLSRKFRFHSIERVRAEIDWMADHGIRYVFNADSNFGMHRRDREIAEYLVESKQRTGYPEKFRTCYGKNTDEKIFAIGKLFHEHSLEKGVTISYQSVDETVQTNIKRDNIKLSCARELQRRFNDCGVPVYTELILGLPGESHESFVTGIDRVLSSGLDNQLFIYICQIFPNTDLDAPDYRARFGIETRKIDLLEIHGRVRDDGWIQEEEEIVVGTHAMPVDDWRRSLTLAWVTMAVHSMKLGSFVLGYLADRHGIRHSDYLRFIAEASWAGEDYPILSGELATFRTKIEALLGGEGRGCVLPEYGDIYWDEEEACFLRVSRDFDAFYDELLGLTDEFLGARSVRFDFDELAAVFRYQNIAMPRASGRERARVRFDWQVAEYFDALHTTEPIELRRGREELEATQSAFDGDLPKFARETILWGRKSGTMLARLTRIDGRSSGAGASRRQGRRATRTDS